MHHEIRTRICLLDYAPGDAAVGGDAGGGVRGEPHAASPRARRLESEGLLRSMHGVGTFVTDVDIAQLAQTYRLRLELAELIGTLDPVPPSPELLDAFRAPVRPVEGASRRTRRAAASRSSTWTTS
jgi:hypothetical protein